MENKKYKILHISPHLGGGVGRVLTNYLKATKTSNKFEHKIFCLDTINQQAKDFLTYENITYKEQISIDELLEEIAVCDIVVVHWWNHPLLFDFLVRFKLPPCRIAFWAHVSGNEAPHIFSHTLFDYPDYCIFTTPMSYLVHEVTSYQKTHGIFRAIWSTGGLDHVKDISKKEHHGFNIGYIGTVDYSKMHPNFIDICEAIDIPDIKFIICGGGHIEELQTEIAKRGLSDKFVFAGFVDDITPYLEIFDLFVYPLARNHYGTCDQALAEAMGCGIVPIVLNNNMENYMVHNMYSGIVAKDEEEFVTAIKEMHLNKGFRDRLGAKAKEEAFRRFSIDQTIKEWDYVFHKLLEKEKLFRKWSGKYSGKEVKPHQIFIESLGIYGEKFDKNDVEAIKDLAKKSLSWKSKSKGTAHQYLSFFQDDKKLQIWSELMK
jgi:L-malate glycosyltransferase